MIAHRVAVNVNRNKPAASAEKRTHFITSPGEDCLSSGRIFFFVWLLGCVMAVECQPL